MGLILLILILFLLFIWGVSLFRDIRPPERADYELTPHETRLLKLLVEGHNYKTAALELAPHGIRVNALAPDITLTEGMASVAPPGAEDRFGLTVPMGRPGHVDEMGGAAVFLAGSMSSYVTGQTIHVDGGTQASSGWYHHPENGSYVLGPT